MAETQICPTCGADLPTDAPDQPCPACLMKLGLESWNTREVTGNGPGLLPTETEKARPDAPTPDELAGLFPQLKILRLIGQGGMGAVYEARQKSLDRTVALKIIKPDAAEDSGFAERFAREARALARLSHQNIVTVHDFGQSEGLYYFVMEYVDGVNLRQMLEARKLEPEQALKIIPHICDALQYAHDEGIVHRDIKPENILIDEKGRLKIADFGLAKLIRSTPDDHSLTGTHQVLGTPRYMSPEQMEGSPEIDHRADIYSLGVVFYEMLTGELPIGRFALPSQKAGTDEQLDEVVLRTLEKEPSRRYQHVSELKTDVESLDAGIAAPQPPKQIQSADSIRRLLRGPSIGLMVAGAMNCLGLLAGAVLLAYCGMTLRSQYVSAWLFLSAISGILILFAALKMRQADAYRTSLLGSVLALLPITPGAIVGLPVGLWALAILTRADVKRAFGESTGTAGRELQPARRDDDIHRHVEVGPLAAPRFSRKAIFGAAWAPFFFIVAIAVFFWLMHDTVPVAREPQVVGPNGEVVREGSVSAQTPPVWLWLLPLTVLPLGLSAPFGTTILGVTAISSIRHSRGRLTGLPIAVGDALLFPLLLLDGLIFLLAVLVGTSVLNVLAGFFGVAGAGVGVAFVAVLAIPVIVAVDILIVWGVWKKVTSPLPNAIEPPGKPVG